MADLPVNTEWLETFVSRLHDVVIPLGEAMVWVATAHGDNTDAAQYSGCLMAISAILVNMTELITMDMEEDI